MDAERLGRFEIEELIGEGGMGSVYAARDTESGDRVALKVLSSEIAEDEEKLRRFEQEATALARIEHEGIVRRLGPIERDGRRVFFPMELLEGKTLARRLREEGPMPVPVALAIVRGLLEALGAAHAAGVVHRDVKPSNILIKEEEVKVTDFGLARMEDITRLTKTGQLMG
ncbi:MAG: serine/threonine-protein kinase, partial [Planctomycetota bacterium]